MTAPRTARVGRPAAGWRRPSGPQWIGALVAVVASLAAWSLPGPARAATGTGYDQITGVGTTASALTVNWTSGLLDNTNTAITGTTGLGTNADRTNQSSSLWFMYDQFQNLQVSVSQTQNIAHQGITVSWNWPGAQTAQTGGFQDDFLQMMECYGDATTGPTPEQCQYGSSGLLPSGVGNPAIGQRTGPLCATGAVASTTSPPRSADGSPATYGCDPLEPSDPSHLAPCPGTYCDQYDYDIPFDPVTDTDQSQLDYATGDTTYYSEFDTNEVQAALVGTSGTGQQQFETLTGVQAPGLGCGLEESDSQPRDCWLVIVPRGTYEPNGFQVTPGDGQVGNLIDSSPLSASNWDMRIQIHLAYAPVGSFCPPGTQEIQTFGTQLVTRAMQSWQIALNQAGDCKQVFAYSAVPETQSTLNLTAGGDVGLAFTTIPIGSEATRDGNPAPTGLPTILYAPVAIAALDFGFNINLGTTGAVTTPIKLTPLLLAKSLTQSYRQDLPDFFPAYNDEGPSWAAKNPINISADPEFQALNSEVPQDPVGPIPLLLTEDHSALNQQVWEWIDADSTASAWLEGTPDTSDGQNTVVDPDYQALNLGKAAIDSYPRAYTGVLSYTVPGTSPAEVVTKDTTDLLPYTDNFDSAASAVLTGADTDLSGGWDLTIQSPQNTPGWWDKAGTQPLGHIFMWAADDTPDLAAYGLVPAQLCNDSGSTCIGPSTASVTAAVSDATADSVGLLEVNPASPGSGAWPLTDVVYAAVATNQSAAALGDYASLISYAIGTGQTPGSSPGDLPPGYLPLPSSLVTQAQAVVTQLQNLASPSPTTSSSSSSSSSSASSSASTASSSSSSSAADDEDTGTVGTSQTTAASSTSDETSSATGGATPTPTPAAAATPATTTTTQAPAATSSLGKVPVNGSSSYQAVALSSPTTGGPVISLPQAQVAAGTTPQQAVGAFRYVLIGVAVVGAGFAGGGTVLRAGGGGLMLWRRRRPL